MTTSLATNGSPGFHQVGKSGSEPGVAITSDAPNRKDDKNEEIAVDFQSDQPPSSMELTRSVSSGEKGRNIYRYKFRLSSQESIRNFTLSVDNISGLPYRYAAPDIRSKPALTSGLDITQPEQAGGPPLSFRLPRCGYPHVLEAVAEYKKTHDYFDYAEHAFLGDEITLKFDNNVTYPALYKKLDLRNGLHLTYGEISGLGGDFYGTTTAISSGDTIEVRVARFEKSFKSLAGPGSGLSKQPAEALKILDLLRAEVDALTDAHKNNKDTAEMYSKLKNIDKKLQLATQFRGWDYPSYGMLAFKNWDHFGEDAEKSYIAGHTAALNYAARSNSTLELAYAMNAFADHFLQDSFSSGHLRTPRRALHGYVPMVIDDADWCSKLMHDEDCAIGLQVKNKKGVSWRAYGDKQLLQNHEDCRKGLQQCSLAIQLSANEIFDAWKNKKIPTEYGAWDYTPTLESARGQQDLAPLIHVKDGQQYRRVYIEKRRVHEFTTGWSYGSTRKECENSGLWNYPIRLE